MLQTLNFSANVLSLGQRILVKKANGLADYNSIIEEIHTDSLSIALPLSQGMFMFPTSSDQYTITAHCETGIFMFDCSHLSHKLTPVGIIQVTIPTTMKKLQQRSNVRINDFIKLTLQPKDSNIKIDGATKNISAGGMLISTNSQMGIGDEIQINFKLSVIDKAMDINVKGLVVRAAEPGEKMKNNYYGVQFLDLDDRVNQHLISYIFRRQSQMIKMRKEA